AALGRRLAVVAQPPDVAAAPDRGGAEAGLARLLNGHIERKRGRHLAEAALRVDHCRRWPVAYHLRTCVRGQRALLDTLDVAGDADHAVAVVPGEVCLDQV